jgi:hypothetical protein
MNDIYSVDLETQKVKEIKVTQNVEPIGVHTAISHRNAMWVFGGLNANGRTNELNKLSIKSKAYHWETIKYKGFAPSPRAGHAMTFDSKNIYVSGGFEPGNFFTFYLGTTEMWR